MNSSVDYVFGGDGAELRRLVVQAAGLETQASSMLDTIPIKPGWRAVDIGCGPVGILVLLSQRVGSSGAVVGVERERRFVDMAIGEIEHRGLSNVEVVCGDAFSTDLEEASFDFAHERLVLMNLPQAEQKRLVSHMLALLKPGGTIALQDYDRVSCLCYPEHPSWTILLDSYSAAFRASGGNGSTGRTLPWLLRSSGARNVRTKVHARFLDVGDSRRMHHLGLLDVMRAKILALGQLSESEFTDHERALRQHLADRATLVMDHLLVQAWGSKRC
jgi:ubiquinone/menaquinone biosynthesis C-methylase UbiE